MWRKQWGRGHHLKPSAPSPPECHRTGAAATAEPWSGPPPREAGSTWAPSQRDTSAVQQCYVWPGLGADRCWAVLDSPSSCRGSGHTDTPKPRVWLKFASHFSSPWQWTDTVARNFWGDRGSRSESEEPRRKQGLGCSGCRGGTVTVYDTAANRRSTARRAPG